MIENSLLSQFDDIRPYNEMEMREALRRITASSSFPLLASYVFPHEEIDAVKERMLAIKTVQDFQSQIMSKFNDQVICRSTSGYTCNGLEKLRPDSAYLFVSNHRDIVLDSSLLQYSLNANGLPTTQITFGANLMSSQLIVDIGKSNKMFKVARPGANLLKFYQGSLHLSQYIRHVITRQKESVWIAQRNGRTKNGYDKTEPAILKMLAMSHPSNRVEALASLNIVPIAISYEWEPCVILKTLELYQTQYAPYIKKPGEDLNSILKGITGHKGRVNIEICDPISMHDLCSMNNRINSEFYKAVAQLIDRQIHLNYKLYPNNYIAYDLLYGTSEFGSCYTTEQKADFINQLNHLSQYEDCDIEQLMDIYLGIYANPIVTRGLW